MNTDVEEKKCYSVQMSTDAIKYGYISQVKSATELI